jgi:GGDEF domain-containing protein
VRAAIEGAMRANGWGVTASVGCASFPSGADATDALVSADRAMYAAKAAGKNQVCRASSREPAAALSMR